MNDLLREGSLGTDVRQSNPLAADLLFELARNVSSLVVVEDEGPPRMVHVGIMQEHGISPSCSRDRENWTVVGLVDKRVVSERRKKSASRAPPLHPCERARLYSRSIDYRQHRTLVSMVYKKFQIHHTFFCLIIFSLI